jgi:hypothetical protein
MTKGLHALSVGFPDSNNIVREALLQRHKCRLMVASSLGDLYAIPSMEQIDVAVFHSSLSRNELRSCASHIRRHWPRTRILLLNQQDEILDDPLYDEKAPPEISAAALLESIEHLADSSRKSQQQIFNYRSTHNRVGRIRQI